MIVVSADCNVCLHKDVCKFRDNPERYMNRLKNTLFDGPRSEVSWADKSDLDNVRIEISCKDYRRKLDLNFEEGVR